MLSWLVFLFLNLIFMYIRARANVCVRVSICVCVWGGERGGVVHIIMCLCVQAL